MNNQHGLVILVGSGERQPSGRKMFNWLFEQVAVPPRVAILETPAGFEPNSKDVAGQVGEFLEARLQNFSPQVSVIPARKRGTSFSPDDPALLRPISQANVLYMGAGSPTYAVRQLKQTLAWQMLTARHRLGAALVLASASTIAASQYTLPVYEIYKVGEELHWKEGLDFFGAYGLSLSILPHWNNTDGGSALDTSRCYMGQARFEQLLSLLPRGQTIVGLDEHTSLVMDLKLAQCQVIGQGHVTILREGHQQQVAHGQTFPLTELGAFKLPAPQTGIADELWREMKAAPLPSQPISQKAEAPPEVLALVEARQTARQKRNWALADALREEIRALGWQLLDTREGAKLMSDAF